MALHKELPGGVDRPGSCLQSVPWPACTKGSKGKGGGRGGRDQQERCGKHAVLRRYPFYLAYENSADPDYVTEKVCTCPTHMPHAHMPPRPAPGPTPYRARVRRAHAEDERRCVASQVFHALEAGVLPVYLGAPNVADFVPPHSVVRRADFDSAAALATHLASLLAQPHKYLEYFAWKRAPLPSAFQHRLAFVGTHAKCRLCRWAYAKKFGFRWSRETQEVLLDPGGAARTRELAGA